jgi:ribosomal protein L16/L10AE
MGKGKGKFNNWIWSLKKNETIFEMSFFKKKKIIHFFLNKLKKKISTNFIISYRVYNI